MSEATPPTQDAQLARTLLTEAREELLKADNKAGFLLASLGAALTALIGAIATGVVEPRRYPAVAQILLWSGCATCLASLAMLGLAMTPRVGSRRHFRAHYFGDALATTSVSQLKAAVRRTDPLSRDLSQLTVLSRTVWIKYRCIRHAMAWSAAFVTLTVLGILTGTPH
ncbi:Pycsar system effector family protein [Streptomyces sp. NPDC086787]|uniref:Pycsar system effector family protein n=1 Tax=Streptomyces sp. NPDC086787 TaxID=3365759 RepID=UPI00382BAEDD